MEDIRQRTKGETFKGELSRKLKMAIYVAQRATKFLAEKACIGENEEERYRNLKDSIEVLETEKGHLSSKISSLSLKLRKITKG